MSRVADKLREARALIQRGWTQGAHCRDAEGNAYGVGTEPKAVCWCAVGAMDSAFTGEPDMWRRAVGMLRDCVGDSNPMRWNDAPERTQAEVLAAFDKAIALAEKSA